MKNMSTVEVIVGCIFCAAIAACWLIALVAWLKSREKRPVVGPFRFVEAVSERKDASMKYDIMNLEVGLPESESQDVVGYELTITRAETAGGELQTVETVAGAAGVATFEGVQDTEVTLSYVAIDNATPPNRSEPATITFSVPDTIAPAQPSGEFTIEAVGERTVGEDDPTETETETPAETETEAPAEETPGD